MRKKAETINNSLINIHSGRIKYLKFREIVMTGIRQTSPHPRNDAAWEMDGVFFAIVVVGVVWVPECSGV